MKLLTKENTQTELNALAEVYSTGDRVDFSSLLDRHGYGYASSETPSGRFNDSFYDEGVSLAGDTIYFYVK